MNEIPVETLKGHDNSPSGFDSLAYIELPNWLAHKLDGISAKVRGKFNLFQVIKETEKAYQIVYCRDASCSWGFCRPTWYIGYVAKSVVKSIRYDVDQYVKEEKEYYLNKYSKEN